MIKETINQLLACINDQDLRQLIHSVAEDHQRLKERIAYLERQLYGSKREKNIPQIFSSVTEIPLFDASEQDEVAVYETQKTRAVYIRKDTLKKRKNKLELSCLPKREIIHDLCADEKYCEHCTYPLYTLGDERSTQVEMVPARYVAVEHVHRRYACRRCNRIVRGSKKPSAIPKAMAGNSMIAKVIVDKYLHHLPVYRQAMIYKTHGLVVSDYTIGRWTSQVADILRPLNEALWHCVVNASYLQIDETPVLCLEKKKKCYMWSYAMFHDIQRPALVLFDFQTTRSSVAVNERLIDFKGIVQTDGYAGYNALRTRPGVVGIGCGAHIRRKFVDAATLAHLPYPSAQKAIDYFKKLYEIEAFCREKKYTAQERQAYRLTHAKPIIDEFHQWLQELTKTSPPKSALGKAIAYALDEWSAWSSYIYHGKAEIDTNWVENQIRPFAVGRRNWLFVGNQHGGESSALLYSLTHSARLNGLDPWYYLFYVLCHTHELRKGQIKAQELLPHRVDPIAINNLVRQYVEDMSVLISTRSII